MDCPACGHPNRDPARFCTACGHDFSRNTAPCPGCGAECPPGARFCPACGRVLDPAEPAPPPAAELDFSDVGLDLPPAAGSDMTVILPRSPAQAPAAPSAAVGSATHPDMTVVLPAGWHPPSPDSVPPRNAPDEVTIIPPTQPAPAAPAAAAPPPGPTPDRAPRATTPPPPSPPAPPAPPPAADHADPGEGGRWPLIAAIAALATLVGVALWFWLAPPDDAPPVVADTPAEEPAPTASPPATVAAVEPPPVEPPAPPADPAPTADAAGTAVTPGPTADGPPLTPRPLRTLYRDACARCHDRGDANSPRLTVPAEWNGLLKRSRTVLANRVLDGHGGAPVLGGVDLSLDEARNLVAYVAQQVERNAASAAARERAAAARADTAPAEAAAPAAPAPAPATDNWLANLRSELARCEQLNFLARIPCTEKARWSYCNNRWDTVPECTVNKQTPP